MIRVDVWLPDPASALSAGAFGAGALIRVERSDDAGATYAEAHTIAVVATALQYQWWDGSGDASSLYRWRVSDAAATAFSDYSAPFAGTSPSAQILPASYATLSDALALRETPITSPAKLRRLASALGAAFDEINSELDRDYLRHPSDPSGDAASVWYADGDGSAVAHAHQGIPAAPVKLELSWDLGQSWVEVPSGQYLLYGSDPYVSAPLADGEPWFHIVLPVWGSYPLLPRGPRTIRVTGAHGWPAAPAALVEANAQRAVQMVWGDAAYEGSIPSDPEFGPQSATGRWPHTLYRFMDRERSRFFCRV